ncbi:MAG: Lrp/AsnC family transcriptional regulator [Gammaproteobacteria bacterium]|nr:Lrp/AsnC family transcriptional regulator [Gammaproteobacteria bacterium]MBL7000663.1 Lrp/AsnC family transcriptional regulator [Gammaproteobacteria bacterium]
MINALSDESPLVFSELEKHLLNDFQHDFPFAERPFAKIAAQLKTDEVTVISAFERLQQLGVISRVGPVFRPNRIGVSTLAAMAIPPNELERVAQIVTDYTEVNHNYQRDHRFNLWFVLTARDDAHLQQVLADIEKQCDYSVMSLPMQEDFFIDLGFDLKWT